MHRLFVALCPPAAIRAGLADAMAGIPGARWQDDDQLHLTLRFIGEVDGAQADHIALALARVGGMAIEVRIAGVGSFDRRGAVDTLWAGLAPRAPLAALHARIDRALVAAGLTPDRRAYVPHITLARLPRSSGGEPALARWLADHAMLASKPFLLDHLILYESTLAQGGARYDPVADWPLNSR